MDRRVIHGKYSKWLDPGYNAFTSAIVLHEAQCDPGWPQDRRFL